MGSLGPTPAMEAVDIRDALANRKFPNMTFSNSQNPLTVPLAPQSKSLSPAGKAFSRFAIEGNAVITGGAGNLAMAAGQALLEHGLTALYILDLPGTLKSSAKAIQTLRDTFPDREILTDSVDVTSAVGVEEAFQRAADSMPGGTIDILCCFAGIVNVSHAISLPSQDFRSVMDVNLTGSFLCAQAAARHMINGNRGGSIMFTASISAHHTNYPQPQAAYNVSKAAVAHLTRNLAAEWAVHGIRVNSISPGYMDTVLNAGTSLKVVRDVWASHCPMGRMGDIEEITGPVVMLNSKRAGRYITGADLLVDGGAMCL